MVDVWSSLKLRLKKTPEIMNMELDECKSAKKS